MAISTSKVLQDNKPVWGGSKSLLKSEAFLLYGYRWIQSLFDKERTDMNEIYVVDEKSNKMH